MDMSNSMKLPNGPGWSPDGGSYWVKCDLLYWSDGSVWDMNDGGLIRTMGNQIPESQWHLYENFSEYSDEKRAALAEENRLSAELEQVERAKRQNERTALVASAKYKLTEEEFDAVIETGIIEERGYE